MEMKRYLFIVLLLYNGSSSLYTSTALSITNSMSMTPIRMPPPPLSSPSSSTTAFVSTSFKFTPSTSTPSIFTPSTSTPSIFTPSTSTPSIFTPSTDSDYTSYHKPLYSRRCSTTLQDVQISNNAPPCPLLIDVQLAQQSLPFLVDTASTSSYIRRSLLPSVEYQRIERPLISKGSLTALGGSMEGGGGVVKLKTAVIGGLEVSVEAIDVEDKQLEALPTRVAGILGLNFLYQFDAVDFNFASKQLLFNPINELKRYLNGSDGWMAVPMKYMKNGGVLGMEVWLKRKGIEGDDEEVKCNAIVDLGSAFSLVNEEAVKRLKLKESKMKESMKMFDLSGSHTSIFEYSIDSISAVDTSNRITSFCENCVVKSGRVKWFDLKGYEGVPAMIIGQDLLQKYRMIFDFVNQMIYFNQMKLETKESEVMEGSAKTLDMEDIKQLLQRQLVEKQIKFQDLQKELSDAALDAGACKSTDDVIALVAKLRLHGRARCQEEQTKQSHEKDVMDSLKYTSLDEEGKKRFVTNAKKELRASNIRHDEDCVTDILDKYLKLKRMDTSNNSNDTEERKDSEKKMGVSSYKEMVKYLQKELSIAEGNNKEKVLASYRNELQERQVDFSDCKSAVEIANRLAYARTFIQPKLQTKSPSSSSPKKSKKRLKSPSSSISKVTDVSTNLFNSPFDKIFDEFFGGFSLFGSSMKKRFGTIGGDNSIIIQLDGDHEMKNLEDMEDMEDMEDTHKIKNKKLNFQQDVSSSSQKPFEESHPRLAEFLKKIDESSDDELSAFARRSLQDPNLRECILKAVTQGYAAAHKYYKKHNNSKALYVLYKLKEINCIQ